MVKFQQRYQNSHKIVAKSTAAISATLIIRVRIDTAHDDKPSRNAKR